MLTKNHNPKITYLNRILALPLMAFIILAFAFKQKNNIAKPDPSTVNSTFIDDILLQKPKESIVGEKDFQKIFNSTTKGFVKIGAATKSSKIIKDTSIKNPLIIVDGKESGRLGVSKIEIEVSPQRIKSVNVIKGEAAIAKYGEKGKDGVVEIITNQETGPENVITVEGKKLTKKPTPLYIIDGKESKEINDLPPNDIETINVLKGISAIDKYGEKAQDGVIEITTKSSDKIFEKVEKEPEFPGGIEAWRRYLDRNLKAKAPAEAGAPSGTYAVEVTFIVNLDGSISDIKVLTNYGYGMEDEVIRLIKRGPKWIPAEQNGHKVVSRRKQIVTFVVSVQ